MASTRRLTAILAADVAGYSRLMGADEEGTHERLKAHLRELIEPKIAEHRGRIVKNTGDGFLAEFSSVVDAVRCAVEVQRLMAARNEATPPENRIEFRIGINLGDVIVEEHDIFGDGVNVAARLETLAEPGGICVSRMVRDNVRDKLDYTFEDLGEQQVKNIARPVRSYLVADRAHATAGPVTPSTQPLRLPGRPSLAVLPFQNMSGDPEQEFFADGVAEDITTALSKVRSLFIIASNSAFTFKGKPAAIKDIGRALGVRYVLDGRVRKAGIRVRVTAQLLEAATGAHLWAERYDRKLTDIFAVQDEITECVRAAVQPAVERSERERAARRPPENLDAWESYHRGMWHFSRFDETENQKAQSFFYRAVELDAQFASAYAMLASTYCRAAGYFRLEQKAKNIRHALDYTHASLRIDPTDAAGHTAMAFALMFSGNHADSIAEADLAVSLDPNAAPAYYAQGATRAWGGRPVDAIDPLQTAIRLSPLDPAWSGFMHALARAHYWAGDYEAAIVTARQLRHSAPNIRQVYTTLIAGLGQMGRLDEAGCRAGRRLGAIWRWLSILAIAYVERFP